MEKKKIRILNLYAGIGGNRKLWDNDAIEVTAVEIEPSIAMAYQHFFPDDKVIVGDAHQFLLDHFTEYDFIWASPPCPSHSVMGKLKMLQSKKNWKYPDMSLYQEIIFLSEFAKGKWVVENTKSYYEPMIKPQISGNHFFWSNFHISDRNNGESRAVCVDRISEKEKKLGYDLSIFSFADMKSSHKKDKVLNNCVEPWLGLHIFKCAFNETQTRLSLNE